MSNNNDNSSTTSQQQPDMQAAAARFFAAPHFAVAGASSNPAKFGHRIFAWYLAHGLAATPLNPSSASVRVSGRDYDTAASPAALAAPRDTSLSVITPPAATAQLLREAKAAGVRAVWLQPGSFTDAELEYALREFPGAAVGGFAAGTVGAEGWCVLVDGEAAMGAGSRGERL